MDNQSELAQLRSLILKCYAWEVLEENPYHSWLEQKKGTVPVEQLSFQEFIREHLQRLKFL
jgi:hypothetical protein